MNICEELKHAIKANDILYSEVENKFYIYGKPSYADDGDGRTDDMTENIQMIHCLFCGKQLAPSPKPRPKIDIGHTCSNCEHKFKVDIFSTTVTCPKCGHCDVKDIVVDVDDIVV